MCKMPNLRKSHLKRKTESSDTDQNVTPLKRGASSAAVMSSSVDTYSSTGKETDEELQSASPDIDSSDEDEGRKMKRFIKERDRIQQTKQDILKKLAIVEYAREIRHTINKGKMTKALKKKKSSSKKKNVTTAGPVVRRQSLRLQKREPAAIIDFVSEYSGEQNPRNPGTQFPMKAIGFDKDDIPAYQMSELKESFLDYDKFMHSLMKIGASKDYNTEEQPLGLQRCQDMLGSLKIIPGHVQKVTRSRIFSISVHPSSTDVLIAAGDKKGNLGLWKPMDIGANDGSYMFKPHVSPITCLKFSAVNFNKLYMCSYDGQLRTMDMEKTAFDKAFADDEDMTISGFDFMDSTHCTLIASHDNCLSIIDTRVSRKENAVHTFEVHNRATKCVSCHPLQKYYVSTSHRDGRVFIFDVRNVKNQCNPVVELKGHVRSVSSAYFSPLTGKHLLTTSYDNRLRIFDTSTITDDTVTLKASCYHFNQTGRWLSSFKATWHPMSDDVFTVGSMNRPRQIDVYSSSAKPLRIISDSEHLVSICSLTCFHQTRSILIGGNSSGKVFMFSSGLEN